MLDSYPLITTIVMSVALAFMLGLIAHRLKLPTILGYLVAGIFLGPNTPGFFANAEIAEQLAEIGVILLMFGVGLHFSVADLVRVYRVAIPGAFVQMSITTMLCIAAASALNHAPLESIVFGITLSVASTVVLLRALEQYKLNHSNIGKIAIGWLIVEDILMVIILVILPVIYKILNEGGAVDSKLILEMSFTIILKIIAFVMVMLFFGKKILPKVLIAISKTKSQELISLGTLAISSGFAFIAYTIFGASFALGAFMAGFILNESKIGKKFAEKSLPLRDIFAVLFFVSAGMLFNPSVLTKDPLMVVVGIALVIFGKAIISYFVMRLLRQDIYSSAILAVSLAQIGEFSFILAAVALKLNFLSHDLYDIVIISAIFSIALNPFLFKIIQRKFKPL
jgi:CPA2 family monovalent cation:H+ antiporter-2